MNYIMTHILEITACCYLFLFVCWTIGYFSNALWGTKFDLGSVWAGIGMLGGSGVFSSIKYLADSWKNSEQGVNPYEKVKEVIKDGRLPP